jgi:uronate dehydrogenase
MSFILVTGGSGEVARGVLPLLKVASPLRLLSLDPPGDDPRRIQADVLDLKALEAAMAGARAVLHLAVASGHPGTYEDDAFNDRRFDVNVKGTFHVFEAARRVGVRRVVHVSSTMAVWGHALQGGPVAGDAPPRPVGTYALTKVLAEQVAEHYARTTELEIVVVRMAAPFDPHDRNLHRRRLRPQQVPFPDLASAFSLALTVPLNGFHIITIVGESSRRIWDLEAARRVLGYTPSIRLDDLGVSFADPFDVPPQAPSS